MEITTGQIENGLSQWTCEITVEFVQAPDAKREAYWAALAWLADEVKKELSAVCQSQRSIGRETGTGGLKKDCRTVF